jgi:TPP-dependent pyruvate/acetoin dehydrogenase alpha subunit
VQSDDRRTDPLEYDRMMMLIRRFEERAGQLDGSGLTTGFCHSRRSTQR